VVATAIERPLNEAGNNRFETTPNPLHVDNIYIYTSPKNIPLDLIKMVDRGKKTMPQPQVAIVGIPASC
jgi:hypothetical protein